MIYETTIVNLYGGPGSGKSTMAAELFSRLKHDGLETELALEYAKDLIWWHAGKLPMDSISIWARQRERQERLMGKVQVVVTDGPLLLCPMFAEFETQYPEALQSVFEQFALSVYRLSGPRVEVFVKRDKPYHSLGRKETEEQSRALVTFQRMWLMRHGIRALEVLGNGAGTEEVYRHVRGLR